MRARRPGAAHANAGHDGVFDDSFVNHAVVFKRCAACHCRFEQTLVECFSLDRESQNLTPLARAIKATHRDTAGTGEQHPIDGSGVSEDPVRVEMTRERSIRARIDRVATQLRAWEPRPVEHTDAESRARDDDRRHAACRTRADDDDVIHQIRGERTPTALPAPTPSSSIRTPNSCTRPPPVAPHGRRSAGNRDRTGDPDP